EPQKQSLRSDQTFRNRLKLPAVFTGWVLICADVVRSIVERSDLIEADVRASIDNAAMTRGIGVSVLRDR
ncbi:hypothetical protein NKH55_31445, partial [Mesorhizobium opportunistum]|uniref:hypothetical protein n=1 Tax=Mesorhizobium opportunistum TaxID=593909 RepID=UPI00333A4B17